MTQTHLTSGGSSLADQIASSYPELLGYLQIPDVYNLLNWAAADTANPMTPAKFQLELQQTNWFKTTPPTARIWAATKLSDPARAQQLQTQTSTQIHQVAAQMGIRLTPDQNTWFTEIALQGGWDQNEIQRQIVDFGQNQKMRPGLITATQDQLKQTAASYGIPIGPHTMRDWAIKINDGSSSTQAFEDFARSQAKAAYPTLAKQIDAGITVRQLADPYMQIAGNLLGKDPVTMNLSDPKWQRALQQRDPKTGDLQGPMTHLDWQRTVMTDPTYGWDHTQNAFDAARNLTDTLGKTFGVSA